MTLEHDIETINEYTQWKAVRQDTSPEAFVRDRAKEQAYGKLVEIQKFVGNIAFADFTQSDLDTIYGMAGGELDW